MSLARRAKRLRSRVAVEFHKKEASVRSAHYAANSHARVEANAVAREHDFESAFASALGDLTHAASIDLVVRPRQMVPICRDWYLVQKAHTSHVRADIFAPFLRIELEILAAKIKSCRESSPGAGEHDGANFAIGNGTRDRSLQRLAECLVHGIHFTSALSASTATASAATKYRRLLWWLSLARCLASAE